MKATIIYYSTTGNTKYVGNIIGDGLRKFNVEPIYFDAIEIIKALKLGRKVKKESDIHKDVSILKELRECIKESSVIGVGAFAYFFGVGAGFVDIFSKTEILPPENFNNIKFIFGFATMRNKIGNALNMIVTAAHNRCPFARYVGGVEVRAPDNYSFYLPEKGERDVWEQKEIRKAKEFSVVIGNRIVGNDTSNPVPYEKTPFFYYYSQQTSSDRLGMIYVNDDACVKCRTCADVCPYDAITFTEEGQLVFDQAACWGCSRCFNLCPHDALNFENVPRSELRMRYPAPFITPGTWTSLAGAVEKGMVVVGVPMPRGEAFLARGKK